MNPNTPEVTPEEVVPEVAPTEVENPAVAENEADRDAQDAQDASPAEQALE